jgi:hypothetical protein
MRSYTIYDLGMNVNGQKFILPPITGDDTPDKDILTKTLELFTPYFDIKNINIEENECRIHCLYEGYDGYYPYEIVFEVFRLKYDNDRRLYKEDKIEEVKDGQLMIALSVEALEELLIELIDIKVLPNVIEKTGLKGYTYRL